MLSTIQLLSSLSNCFSLSKYFLRYPTALRSTSLIRHVLFFSPPGPRQFSRPALCAFQRRHPICIFSCPPSTSQRPSRIAYGVLIQTTLHARTARSMLLSEPSKRVKCAHSALGGLRHAGRRKVCRDGAGHGRTAHAGSDVHAGRGGGARPGLRASVGRCARGCCG